MSQAAPKVRLDRSKPFSTVHGEREPNDRLALVHFYQDGLPHDAQGFLLVDAIDQKDDELMALAERKLKKAAKTKPASSDDASPDGEGDNNGAGGADGITSVDDVNLSAWARGEQKVPWHLLAKRIQLTYSKNVGNLPDALEFLMDNGVVTREQLPPHFIKAIS